jgi:threonine dehydrogenase-like Zn-dependent dehydrogenase
MMSKMLTNVITGPSQSEVYEMEMPVPKADEVLIEVHACGVCASDLEPWLHPFEPAIPPNKDQYVRMGHEPAGVVQAVGEGVTQFKVGDRVASMVAPAYAQYVCTPESITVAVPDEVPFDYAMAEPAACLIAGLERIPVEIGETVALVGCGFMGLALLQLLRARGVGKIVAIDVSAEALDNALRFGADEALTPQALPERYRCLEWDQKWSHGFTKVFEVTGKQKGIDLAIALCKAHAYLAAFGYHQDSPRVIDFKAIGWKALNLISTHERRDAAMRHGMEAGLEMIKRGKLDMSSLVTHQFQLGQLDSAFEMMMAKPKGYIKGVLKPFNIG